MSLGRTLASCETTPTALPCGTSAGICLSHPSSLPCFCPALTTESYSLEFPHSMSVENFSPRTLVFSLGGLAGQQLEPNSLTVLKLWEKRVVLYIFPLQSWCRTSEKLISLDDLKNSSKWWLEKDFPKVCYQWFIPLPALLHDQNTAWRWSHDCLGQALQSFRLEFPHWKSVLCMSSLYWVLCQGEGTPCTLCPLQTLVPLCHLFHALNFGTEELNTTSCFSLFIYCQN